MSELKDPIEAVKEILHPECYGKGDCPDLNWGACQKCEDVARQIDALYPKPKFNNALEADAHNWDVRELPQPDELISDEELREWVAEVFRYSDPLTSRKPNYRHYELADRVLQHCTPSKLLKDKLSFHVVHKEALADVGEWAECQGVGVFVFFPDDTYWQALKGGK